MKLSDHYGLDFLDYDLFFFRQKEMIHDGDIIIFFLKPMVWFGSIFC